MRWLALALLLLCLISAGLMASLRFVDPPTSHFIKLNKRHHNTDIQHQWVPLTAVSEYYPLAVIAAEDQQFTTHHGFDWQQIRLVLQLGQQRGASTITQQTVKNLFLWPQRSLVRKTIEAWLALWMELIVPKKRILELYVNFAQLGGNIFGIAAASQHYFAIPAAQLSPRQAALLAASLPAPGQANPAAPSEKLRLRAEYILDQMSRIGGRRLVREL